MLTIDTLIPDIYDLLKRRDGWFTDEIKESFSRGVSDRLQRQLGSEEKKASLRLSQMGPRCPKALWHAIRRPETAEALPPWATIKYSFGHIIEALAIELAKAAGHQVTGEQDELVLDGIVGHRDCVIDGCTVDVKSASSISFNRFKSGQFEDNFGYLDQLDGYVCASLDDPLVTVKDKGYILAVDKQLGHMCLYEHTIRLDNIRRRIAECMEIVARSSPPHCKCGTIVESSGNERLDLRASYSPYKYVCFPHLRTFLYSSGPVYLTKVVKRPYNKDGPIREVDKFGNTVYH